MIAGQVVTHSPKKPSSTPLTFRCALSRRFATAINAPASTSSPGLATRFISCVFFPVQGQVGRAIECADDTGSASRFQCAGPEGRGLRFALGCGSGFHFTFGIVLDQAILHPERSGSRGSVIASTGSLRSHIVDIQFSCPFGIKRRVLAGLLNNNLNWIEGGAGEAFLHSMTERWD